MSLSPILQSAAQAASDHFLFWPDVFVGAVVAILDAEAPKSFKADVFPDKPEDYDVGEYEGAILVHWLGSKYGRRSGGTPVVTARTFTFDVAIISRGVSGMKGAPNIVEAVRIILQGRAIEGATALVPIEDGLSGRSDQLWRYDITFEGEAPAVGGAWPHEREVR